MGESVFQIITGGITAPEGFTGAAVHCGIKAKGADLVLIHSDRPVTAAVTITTNQFRAAPTFVTEEHIANGQAQAIVVNSGNANAATGMQGRENARQMAWLTAEALNVASEDVIVCSTGHIGVQLPMDNIATGIQQAGQQLGRNQPELLARGIMTTDTFPKMTSVRFDVDGATVKMGAIAKGAGMICPDMATMLCFITTDLAISAEVAQDSLRQAVARSFNCITVDGCMSTNDTVALLANGAAGNSPITCSESTGYQAFTAALGYVTTELAKMIVHDGEEATKFVEITVNRAKSWEQARRIGWAIANYDLLKCSIYGEDFNWGRVVASLGAAGEAFDPAKVTLKLAGITVWKQGEVAEYDQAQACQQMTADEIAIEVDLGFGESHATVWTCDLTPEYVRFNTQ